ncbi:arginase [Parashewanella curva]|uniref:Arginase n=1 Tax=Parashewanella curva TaxID=2338552 RepID=A0A3L8Q145_9GAMM|nr:formimidoylglutamase [Parashewanella curva]RLV61356.1 arginase [Parashewanella curva]
MQWFIPYSVSTIQPWLSQRTGETRFGDKIRFVEQQQDLTQLKRQGVKFVLIGVNEDIGPQGNLGKGGSGDGFKAAVSQWINLQSNAHLTGSECAIWGEIDCRDLNINAASVEQLRANTEIIDQRVIEAVQAIFDAGLEPIVIGGGHNNAYGLLTAAKQSFSSPMAAVNLDPHSDFRLKEGRHSGNGFSYAAAEGALACYHVLGLHELKNSAANLEQLQKFGGSWHSLQQIWVRRELSLTDALVQITDKLKQSQLPVGLELDVDSINAFPSSAMTYAGIPLLDATHYVYYIAKHNDCRYAHFAEPAAAIHPISGTEGFKQVGQSLSELIYAYIQGRLDK